LSREFIVDVLLRSLLHQHAKTTLPRRRTNAKRSLESHPKGRLQDEGRPSLVRSRKTLYFSQSTCRWRGLSTGFRQLTD